MDTFLQELDPTPSTPALPPISIPTPKTAAPVGHKRKKASIAIPHPPPSPAPAKAPSKVPTQPPLPKLSASMTPSELQCAIANDLRTSNDLPAEVPLTQIIGKSKLMEPQKPHGTNHPATAILQQYAEAGCPVECGDPWSLDHIILLLE